MNGKAEEGEVIQKARILVEEQAKRLKPSSLQLVEQKNKDIVEKDPRIVLPRQGKRNKKRTIDAVQ